MHLLNYFIQIYIWSANEFSGLVLQLFFIFRISYQNEHNYGQDVKDSITEQRPPAQRDGLEGEFTHSAGASLVR